MDVDIPFGVAAQLLEPLGGRRLVEAGVDPGAARASVLGRAKEWVERAAADGPLVCLVDDAQWSDADSLDVLSLLAGLDDALPVAIVAALRPWPSVGAECARRLEATGKASVTTLSHLSRGASDELLARHLATVPDESVAASAYAFASGNPYLTEQAALLIRTNGALPRPSDLLPDASRLQPMANLTEPAILCAQAAAVLGTEFRVAIVGTIARLEDDDMATGLDALFAAGVLHATRADHAEFAHALIAQAVLDDLLPGRRAALHRRAFEFFADIGEVAVAARHAVAADLVGDAVSRRGRGSSRSRCRSAPAPCSPPPSCVPRR